MRYWQLIVLAAVTAAAGCFPWRGPEPVEKYTSVKDAIAAMNAGKDVTYVNLYAAHVAAYPSDLGGIAASLQKLSLRRNALAALPPEIGKLQALRWLDLAEGKLTDLPAEIADLKQLKVLYLSDNQFDRFPKGLCDLPSLEYLNLDRNTLGKAAADKEKVAGDAQKLPDITEVDVSKLVSLKWLRLCKNGLTGLPSGIGVLKNLQRLYLRDNKLTQLPEELSGLSNLTDLSLARNALETLPAWIGDLTSLERLDLNGNKITSLPDEIGKLKKLRGLRLDRNRLSSEEKQRIKALVPTCHVIF